LELEALSHLEGLRTFTMEKGVLMYFWKIEDLKKDIRNNNFTEKDRFIYLIISLMLLRNFS